MAASNQNENDIEAKAEVEAKADAPPDKDGCMPLFITVVLAAVIFGGLSVWCFSGSSHRSCGGNSKEASRADEAIAVVKGNVPAQYEGLSYSASENSDGTFTVSSGGYRWKVKNSDACADNGAAKMLT